MHSLFHRGIDPVSRQEVQVHRTNVIEKAKNTRHAQLHGCVAFAKLDVSGGLGSCKQRMVFAT